MRSQMPYYHAMQDTTLPTAAEARHERTESARLDNFVDGAFAFAITLLVIGGASLPKSVSAFEHALLGAPAFAACFAQLALFWHGHVRWRDTVRLTDGASLRLSLLLVFFALIFVFPLHLVFASFFNGLTGGVLSPDFAAANANLDSLVTLFVCYGLSFACMAGTLALLFRHGLRSSALPREQATSARISLLVWSCCAVVGMLSTLIALSALLIPNKGWVVGLAGLCYVLLAFTGVLARRYRHHLATTLPT